MDSAAILTAFERCRLAAYWARDWQRFRLDDTQMIQRALREGLTTTKSDHGQHAGEACYGMGAEPGLQTNQNDVHSQVVHLAALTDILATAIRKDGERPWRFPKIVELEAGIAWRSAAYLSPDGNHLRRIVLASSWSEDRHYSECRSWFSMGEVCAYGLPMQMIVCVIGKSRGGKRHSWWTHGLRHPMNKVLRFRKKHGLDEPFKASWKEIWREDYSDISTKAWLQAMLDDEVLQDCCFKIDIPVPEEKARKSVLELAIKKLRLLDSIEEQPDRNFSTCDLPRPCVFRVPCHGSASPSRKYGFIPVEEL